MHGGNHRFRECIEALNDGFHFVLVGYSICTGEAAKLLDIGACRKSLPVATENHSTSCRIAGEKLKMRLYLLIHRPRQRVQGGRTRERQDRHRTFLFQEYSSFFTILL